MTASAQGGEINPGSIIAKISLLTIHFKKLQIIWSKSPAHTADIFRSLKSQAKYAADPDL